jgi:type IV secretory system conjugative DNA transfer VirD4/TraG family protein
LSAATEMTWCRLKWPRDVTPEQAAQLFRLLAVSGAQPVIIEAVGSVGGVEHRLALPSGYSGGMGEQLRAALPGLSIERLPERPMLDIRHAVELRLSTGRRALRADDPSGVSRALLTALADLHKGEQIVIQWVLARSVPALAVPNRLATLDRESWIGALLLAPFSAPRQIDPEVRYVLRLKQGEPGWRASARIGVTSGSATRERQLVRQVVGALSSSEAPSVGWRVRATNPKRVREAVRGWRAPLRLNAQELAVVSSFPVGSTAELPVAMIGSRLVPPSSKIRRTGRVLGRASFPGRERPLALTATDSLRHVHILGPTGVGKSTLLLNLVAQDMAAGRSVVVIEPKGDLIADVLARVPAERLPDVVHIDPSDEQPVGLNPLAPGGRSPELAADQLLGLLHSLYAASWGPRTHDILGSALLTLARTPRMTLAALPVLLTDASFRRRIVSRVHDPIGLGPFWATYESWSEQQRGEAIAPSLNKLRPLLLRPEVRAVIGQARPRFELRQLFTTRKILLVNLNRGVLGPETSALLGSIVISQLWQAILGRTAVAPERRHPVTIILDEFQSYLHLPLDLSDALAQARGLGASFHLAHQFMHQLDPAMRSSVLANTQSRVAFRLASEDARALASGGALTPEDFQSLGAYQAYAQLVAVEAIQPWCSLATLPAPEPVSDPEAVRATSREHYGVPRTVVEDALRELFIGRARGATDDLKPRRRDRREQEI